MPNLKPVRRGDTWHGHLWVVDDPETKEPRDITGWACALEVRATEGIDGELAWSATTQTGLRLIDGDGRTVEIACCGSKRKQPRILEPRGYPYIVEALPVDPDLAVRADDWHFRLRAVDPNGTGPPIKLTLDAGRWAVTT